MDSKKTIPGGQHPLSENFRNINHILFDKF